MSPRTCNGYLTKLRNLLDWAQAEGVVEATLGRLLAQEGGRLAEVPEAVVAHDLLLTAPVEPPGEGLVKEGLRVAQGRARIFCQP